MPTKDVSDDLELPETISTASIENVTETGGSNTPNAGVIAGAVVGSIIFMIVIIGGFLIAFRMGKRHRDGAHRRHRFRDKLRSLGRPTITWTKHDKQQMSTVHTIAIDAEQPGLIPTVQDRNPDLPATYIDGSNKAELPTVSSDAASRHFLSQQEQWQAGSQQPEARALPAELPTEKRS